jgi:hypothetical protein
VTTETETTALEQIWALLNDRAAAITAKDPHRAVAFGYDIGQLVIEAGNDVA